MEEFRPFVSIEPRSIDVGLEIRRLQTEQQHIRLILPLLLQQLLPKTTSTTTTTTATTTTTTTTTTTSTTTITTTIIAITPGHKTGFHYLEREDGDEEERQQLQSGCDTIGQEVSNPKEDFPGHDNAVDNG